jgi:hypothetical protein
MTKGGEGSDGHTQEAACLNCGTLLIGSHCHNCGQHAHVHKTVAAFFHDLLHGVFHFEGKIWRTLPLLAWKPGTLTREYIDGRRASYVSPIALFLFCVFLLFAVVKSASFDFTDTADVEVNGKHISGLDANLKEIGRLEGERLALNKAGKPTGAVDGEIEGRKSGIAAIRKLSDPVGLEQAAAAAQARSDKPILQSDIPALNAAFKKASENPQLAIYKLQSNAYKFAWALIPISVPFVWLLFSFRRRFHLYDHTVFVTYSLCFMMLLVSLLTVLRSFGLPVLTAGLNLIPPLHIYRQVRTTYALSRWSAAWRTLALCAYALVALTLFLALMIGLGAEG